MGKNVFLLDNNDSFTYNIVNHLRKMDEVTVAVSTANDFQLDEIAHFDKVIISPGPGLPEEFPRISQILQAYHTTKPILGICMGHQAIGTFFGAELIKLSPVIHGQARTVEIVRDSPLWSNIPDRFKGGLYHSWVLASDSIPDSLLVTAVTGDNVVMAIQSKKYPVFGVQFHPESYMTGHGFEILRNFIEYDDPQ